MSIGRLSEFNVKSGQWSSYIDRLDMFFEVNKVTDNLKLPTLIATVGDDAYELLVNLASPKKPSELSYTDAVELLRQHLQPTPSSLAERYRFRQKRQEPGEDVASYVAELKKLARYCKFASNLNESLRDQFICGLRSDVIRQRLFAEDDSVTFVGAVKLASSLEAAERNAAMVECTSTGNSVESGDTRAVHALTPIAGRSGRGPGGAGAGTSARQARPARGPPRSEGARCPTVGMNCGACGATNHDYSRCRFREYTCSRCQRTGHLRRVCPEYIGQPLRGGPTQRRGGHRQPVYFGDIGHESGDASDGDDIEEQLNLMGLNNYKPV
ncbi:uncharacterized protein [Choristoneura fumiferana]|uniref:uncharacterized protein n=1 Tax=Choristoneura fumiferana TaxID=7141 RepID=UPI003D1541CF